MSTVAPQVVHFDLPKDSESFLHRSGRTGRAGKSGTTIAMFRPNESGYFRRIVRDVGAKNVEFIGPPGPQAVMSASAKQVPSTCQLWVADSAWLLQKSCRHTSWLLLCPGDDMQLSRLACGLPPVDHTSHQVVVKLQASG